MAPAKRPSKAARQREPAAREAGEPPRGAPQRKGGGLPRGARYAAAAAAAGVAVAAAAGAWLLAGAAGEAAAAGDDPGGGSSSGRRLVQGRATGGDDWEDLAAWLRANGARVHRALKVSAARHGGFEVRGLLVNETLPKGAVLLRLPQQLWVGMHSFPELAAGRRLIRECERPGESIVTVAAGLALEARQGSASRYAPLLRMLPTLGDFRSFYPLLAEGPLLADFGELPVLRSLHAHDLMQMAEVEACFSAWRAAPESPLRGLSSEELLLFYYSLLTRRFEQSRSAVFIMPAADILNTAKGPDINANWEFRGDAFEIKATQALQPGTELLSLYCKACDNELMLHNWGVYLEDNPYKLNAIEAVNCSAAWSRAERPGASAESLRAAALAVLEAESAEHAGREGWNAPRCRPAALAGLEQGPLRCSLARLAWEKCAEQWGLGEGQPRDRPASPQAPQSYAGMHTYRGGVLQVRGNLKGAEAALRAALEVLPTHYEAHSKLADVLLDRGDAAAAEKSMRAALALEPDRFGGYNNLGHIQAQLGDLAGAARSFEVALGLNPGSAVARQNLELMRELQGK